MRPDGPEQTEEFELPPPSALSWMVREYAAIRAEHAGVIGDPELVLPTDAFFPDPVTASAEGVATLLARTMTYAPLATDLPVTFEFLQPGESAGGSCASGGCGGGAGDTPLAGLRATDEGYVVALSTVDAGDPARLMASLARVTGGLVLHEGGDDAALIDDARLEVAATAIGLGVLVSTGSYLYSKSCGGARVHRVTALSVSEVTALLALYCRVHQVKARTARAHLAMTQREAFDRAVVFWESNERVVATLRTAPELLVGGAFELDSQRGPVARLLGWLGRGKSADRDVVDAVTAKPVRVRTEAEERRFALAKAMAEDAHRAAVAAASVTNEDGVMGAGE